MQRDERPAAQTDVVALSVDGESLNPRLRAAGCHSQIECLAVPMETRFGYLPDLGHCQSGHFPTFFPTFCVGKKVGSKRNNQEQEMKKDQINQWVEIVLGNERTLQKTKNGAQG